MDTTSVIPAKAGIQVANMTFYDFIDVEFKESKWYPNEPPRGKPRGIFKGKINCIAASCGELNPADFASLLK
jgi:hypothetical protein